MKYYKQRVYEYGKAFCEEQIRYYQREAEDYERHMQRHIRSGLNPERFAKLMTEAMEWEAYFKGLAAMPPRH